MTIGKEAVGVLLSIALIAGCSAMTGKSAGRNIDDASISAAVKTKLGTERAATLTSIDVDTVNGTVYLTGTVPNMMSKDRATQIAREVEGVRSVVNNLQTRPTAGDAPNTQNPRR